MRSIILADRQEITKQGLFRLLEQSEFTGSVYEVDNQRELIEALKENSDTVVILDYVLFDFTSVNEMFFIHQRFYEADWIIFSEELSPSFLQRIYHEKAFSIVLKSSTLSCISEGLQSAINGERFVCERVCNFLEHASRKTNGEVAHGLTVSEREILKLIAMGKTVKEIAEERISSIHTIITHKKNIFRKLEINNVHEATKYAIKAGLLDSIDYYI